MNSQIRILGALAAVIVVALIVWVALESGDSTGDEPARAGSGAGIVSATSLRETAAASETPIYWVGPPAGSRLELSRSSPDRTYVRYLTGGAAAGDPRPFLTVGSYRIAGATAALRRQGKRDGGVLATAPEGGVVYFSRNRPKSVYLAYPGENIEIEVFAPAFQQALQLVTAGRIVPVE